MTCRRQLLAMAIETSLVNAEANNSRVLLNDDDGHIETNMYGDDIDDDVSRLGLSVTSDMFDFC